MNHSLRQKIIKSAIGAVVGLTLFPPFVANVQNGGSIGLGHGFILSPPASGNYVGTVDVSVLLSEWLAVAIVATLFWRLHNPSHKSTAERIAGTIADAKIESARIKADAIIQAAEIAKK